MVDSLHPKGDKGGLMEAFNAVKVKLSDYEVLTTLGTGLYSLNNGSKLG